MKIAIAGTLWLNTPPQNYGGTEDVIYQLIQGLTKKGHEVTFFGPATAKVPAKIIPTVSKPLRDMHIPWENSTYTLYHFTQVFDRAKNFDIIHVHLNKSQDYISLPFSVYKNIPTLFTLHFRVPDTHYKPDRYRVLKKYQYLPYSSISMSQQAQRLNYIANVYNSVDTTAYPFVAKPKDYFVWLGKIASFKGTKEAILAAKKYGATLYILGTIERGVPEHLSYFMTEIQPLIDNQHIFFYESVGMPEKATLLGNAKALLNPIQWDEPFGLVMIESQAAGTPVIAYNHGAAKELVQDGQTGFLVSSVDEMVQAMKKIHTIERKSCRKYVKEKFSVEKMVEEYLRAYQKVIKHWPEYYQQQTKTM